MRELSLSGINTDLVHLRSWLEFVRPAEATSVERLSQVRRLLRVIPPVERDVIELHFFAGKNQEQIGDALGLTQQAVSHRMRRACERLAFLLDHPRLVPCRVRRNLTRIWPGYPPVLPQLLSEFARTSSQTETAKRLGTTPQRVRQYLALALAYFQAHDSRVARRYGATLARLQANRSILCEVPVPRRAHGRESCPRPHDRREAREVALQA